MGTALEAYCQGAENAVRAGFNILILSDRPVDADNVSIPPCSPPRQYIIT